MKNFIAKLRRPALVAPLLAAFAAVFVSCSEESDLQVVPSSDSAVSAEYADVSPEGIARMLAEIPFGIEQVQEVWAGVNASASNGYDEEYPFVNLLDSPGSGVGDAVLSTRSALSEGYEVTTEPLSSFILDFASARAMTRAGDFLEELRSSGLQIYWPYSEDWDGETMPVITFIPDEDSDSCLAFSRTVLSDGSVALEDIQVDEDYAMNHPVWVVNWNEDSDFLTPQMLEKLGLDSEVSPATRSSSSVKSLKIKEFKAHRNYDPWYCGASEFFVKCGSVENFSATTTDDLKLYYASMTDLEIVVKRKKVGSDIRINTLLVSEWTDQLEECAFLMIEDDGGTTTTWKCNATVKIKSKSYGVEIEFPFHKRDDIVWRGTLSNSYLESVSGSAVRLGDVSITFTLG